MCAVSPRAPRTPVDGRRRHRWSQGVEESGVEGLRVEAKKINIKCMPLSDTVVVSPTRLDRSARISANVRLGAVFRIDWGREGERRRRLGLLANSLLPTPQVYCLNMGASPWSSG